MIETNTFCHRLIDEPSTLEHKGQKVMYFTVLPAGEGLEEPNAPCIMLDHDLSNEGQLRITKMMEPIDIHFDGKTYEYRTQVQTKDEDGNVEKMVVETEMGF
jgi:hypothetical protein